MGVTCGVATVVLSWVTVVSAAVTLVMHVLAHVLLAQGRRKVRASTPVSVLRPLKGLVDGLEENLESLMAQDHENYEVIVAAASSGDPALEVARQVKSRHPNRRLQIMVGEYTCGKNPKVRLLRRMLPHACYEAILISDDNVWVGPDYLSRMAGALSVPGTGLVSNLVVGIGAQTVGAICENLQLNTFVLSSVASSFLARYPVVVGKSMLMQRQALAAAGGFEAVADVLAEDHVLGRAVLAAGYRVTTLGYPVYTVNAKWSVKRMLSRHIRWSKIRAAIAPWAFSLEWLLQPLLLLAVAHLLAASLGAPRVPCLSVASWLTLVATLSDIVLTRRVQGRHFRFLHVALLPLSRTLALVAYITSLVLPRVHWRNEVYRIGHNSRLLPVTGENPARPAFRYRRAA